MISEPSRPIPTSFRAPRRPLRVAITARELARCPVLNLETDAAGWPVGILNADSLATQLLEARCTFATGDAESLWKLLPPSIGAAIAASVPGQMVKHNGTWWGWLNNGSIMARRGQQYGHLCKMDRRLINALADSGFSDIGFPNSPGSVAAAILLNYASLPNLYRGEIPLAVLDLAHQCDKGGRMEALQLGTFPHVYCYDYTGAYAAVLAGLPDARQCVWLQDRGYHPDAYWGFVRCRIAIPSEMHVSPIAYRLLLNDQQKSLEGLRFVTGDLEVCLIKPEYDMAVSLGCKAEILDAWWGYPENADKPFANLVSKMFALRQQHPALSADIKLLTNAMIGQMSSAHSTWDSVEQQSKESVSPCWNSVYASYVRGLQRVKLYQSIQDWDTVASLTIDGFVSTAPTSVSDAGGLGVLRLDGEGPATILTDYAKDRPGHAPMWRAAAATDPTKLDHFTLPLRYRAGLGMYNQPGMTLKAAHEQLGKMAELRTEFPIGSVTRRTAARITVSDLLRESVLTYSMTAEALHAQ